MSSNERRFGFSAWSAWLIALVIIYPVPHTIAFRNLLVLAGLIALGWHWRQTLTSIGSLRNDLAWLSVSKWGLAILTGWIALHSLLIAPLPSMALDRVRADWLMALLMLVVGALVAMRNGKDEVLRGVVWALILHMLLVVVFQSWQRLDRGYWPFGAVPFADRDYHSTLNGFLFALLLADRVSAMVRGITPLHFPAWMTWGFLIFVMGTDVLLRTRNGTVVNISLAVVAISTLYLDAQRRKRWGARQAVALGLVTLLGALSVHNDSRWSALSESVVVAIESDSKFWMTFDPHQVPLTPSGRPLEQSAYARASWARQALESIASRPLGIGYGHDAFGRAIEMRYGHKGMGSSHSGWLDFALALGIPGLMLLFATGLAVLAESWRQFRNHGDGHALLLGFFVFSYLLRCLLDGHLSGWRLTMFSLIVGLIIGSSMRRRTCD